MTAIKMQKGNLITLVYNDSETIADAEKKGFHKIDMKTSADSKKEPVHTDGLLPGEEGFTRAEIEALNSEPADASPEAEQKRKGK